MRMHTFAAAASHACRLHALLGSGLLCTDAASPSSTVWLEYSTFTCSSTFNDTTVLQHVIPVYHPAACSIYCIIYVRGPVCKNQRHNNLFFVTTCNSCHVPDQASCLAV